MTQSLSTFASLGITALFLALAVLTFRARRSNQKAYNLAAVRATNIAALRWAYEVQVLAASHGASWLPPLPREMTPEYLSGRADAGDNPELAELANLATGLMGGQKE
jgi:hypothetical protein